MSAKNVITNGVLGGDATISATGGTQVCAVHTWRGHRVVYFRAAHASIMNALGMHSSFSGSMAARG